jgi:Cdc6-like AAA superfamily ATPase
VEFLQRLLSERTTFSKSTEKEKEKEVFEPSTKGEGGEEEKKERKLIEEGEEKKVRNSDEWYKSRLAMLEKTAAYKKIENSWKSLPIYSFREEILEKLSKSSVLIVSGETGSGKTTQIPKFILQQLISQGQSSTWSILCTQPRRITATSVRNEERNEEKKSCPLLTFFFFFRKRLQKEFLLNLEKLKELEREILLLDIKFVWRARRVPRQSCCFAQLESFFDDCKRTLTCSASLT